MRWIGRQHCTTLHYIKKIKKEHLKYCSPVIIHPCHVHFTSPWCIQGQIQDFWIGGSNLQREWGLGGSIWSIYQTFLEILDENEIIGAKRWVRATPPPKHPLDPPPGYLWASAHCLLDLHSDEISMQLMLFCRHWFQHFVQDCFCSFWLP